MFATLAIFDLDGGVREGKRSRDATEYLSQSMSPERASWDTKRIAKKSGVCG